MMLAGRSTPAGVLLAGALLAVSLAGCDGSSGGIVTVVSSGFYNTTVPPATARAATPPSTSAASTPTTRPANPGTPAATSALRVPPSAVPVPAHLCSGMDAAQNAADAYMGALSAGNAAEAMACVLPNTVPETLTRSLLGRAGTTAVYLPRDGVDGPSVFGYQGNGKSIDVTVSKQPGGQFRVTKVAVRGG